MNRDIKGKQGSRRREISAAQTSKKDTLKFLLELDDSSQHIISAESMPDLVDRALKKCSDMGKSFRFPHVVKWEELKDEET